MRPLVVLDKDFLISTSTAKCRELYKQYSFVVIESLLGECFQYLVDPSDREKTTKAKNALYRFASNDTPLSGIELHQLRPLEIDTQVPCWPLEDYVNRDCLVFNEEFLNGRLQFSEAQKSAILDWRALHQKLFQGEIITSVPVHSPIFRWDEELAELRSEGSSLLHSKILAKIPSFRARIATNSDFIRQQYSWMRPFAFPPARKIDERWLLFRAIQCQLLVHLDSLKRRVDEAQSKRIQLGDLPIEPTIHDLIDYSYCLVAVQLGAIATNEKKQQQRFRLLCPGGLILANIGGEVRVL